MNIAAILETHFATALGNLGWETEPYSGMIRLAHDPRQGDYQANMAMPLAKKLGRKPPDVAAEIIAQLTDRSLIAALEVAGPGFINLKLSDSWIQHHVQGLIHDPQLGVAPVSQKKKIVIDYSGPNVAKPLHVGHLRSTIIGDSLTRILRFLGHQVIGDNHLGDWGTQFGILIYGYKHHLDREAYARDPVRELARLYVHVRDLAKVSHDDDDDSPNPIMQACRLETARLHAGDPENLRLWQEFIPACLEMLRPIYERLDVQIDHALGESFYHPMLAGVVQELLEKQLATENNGAIVVPNANNIIKSNREEDRNEEPPSIIQKRDGAFTYTTSDLATIKYRMETWQPDAMLYVVDFRQTLHFKTLFANARRWGYDHVEFVHLSFGSVLGEDGRPLRSRDGGVPELGELLDQAVAYGLKKYRESYEQRKSQGHDVPDFTETEILRIAEVVGIGAVKYADLSSNRSSDYKFDLARMLASDGNTGPYMQYAYARCRSILRKAGGTEAEIAEATLVIKEFQERSLALQLLKFEQALLQVQSKYEPHHLTGYLWDVSKAFSSFFESCPVLTAAEESTRRSRLLLVLITARIIKQALSLLGIATIEQM